MDLKEILDDLMGIIRTEVTDFSTLINESRDLRVKEYDNEFIPDAEWTPVFPSAFVELTSFSPDSYNNQGKMLRGQSSFLIYVANKYYGAVHVLDTVGRVVEAVSVATSTVDGITYKFKTGQIKLLGKIREIKIYTIEVIAL